MGGKGTERADDLWLYCIELFNEKGFACLYFIGLRISVVRGTTFDDIGNVNFLTGEINRIDDLGKELTGTAYKGLSLHILFTSGTFTDKDELSGRIPGTENDMSAMLMQFTPCALSQLTSDVLKLLILIDGSALVLQRQS
jgi:hypothetical protein